MIYEELDIRLFNKIVNNESSIYKVFLSSFEIDCITVSGYINITSDDMYACVTKGYPVKIGRSVNRQSSPVNINSPSMCIVYHSPIYKPLFIYAPSYTIEVPDVFSILLENAFYYVDYDGSNYILKKISQAGITNVQQWQDIEFYLVFTGTNKYCILDDVEIFMM